MREPEDVPVHHLIADTGAFVKKAPLVDIGSKIYTIDGVVAEIKDKETKQFLKSLPFELILREPTVESVKSVIEISKKTGDYASLSLVDLKVIALTLDLHIEHIGKDSVIFDVHKKEPIIEEIKKKDENLPEKPKPGFGDWVDDTNIDDIVAKMEAVVKPSDSKMKVACLSTDFSVQNVLKHMNLNISSINGMKITKLRSFILRCRICKKTTAIITKVFCPYCGHDSLHKVGVSVDKAGTQRIHINWNRENVTRGYRFNIPMPKGGKHEDPYIYMEDQRIPMNRMAKIVEDPVRAGPFPKRDTTSRSAMFGLRNYGRRMKGNPNECKTRNPKKRK